MSLDRHEGYESIESDLFARFEKLGAFQAYEYLDGDAKTREATKNLFLSDQARNPTLDYPKLGPWLRGEIGSPAMNHVEREKALLQLKKDAMADGLPEAVRKAYQWRINEKVAELRMMVAMAQGNMKAVDRYVKFVYGVPNEGVAAYELTNLEKQISSIKDPVHLALGQDLLQSLPKASSVAVRDEAQREINPVSIVIREQLSSIVLPSKDVVAAAQTNLWQSMGVLAGLLQRVHTEGEKEYEAAQIKDLFEEALALLKATGWQVVITNDSKSAISVKQESRKVQIPHSRKVQAKQLAGLLAHEIGIHVGRRVQGERSRMKLLALGFDRYESGEEGVTTQAEQIIAGTEVKDFSGLEAHLAISLARGVDGHPRDFRETYEILYKLFSFQKYPELKKKKQAFEAKQTELASLLAAGGDPVRIGVLQTEIGSKSFADIEAEHMKVCQDAAWNRVVRTFRGTDCQTAGVCFTKDMIYREGLIGAWSVVSNDAQQMLRFSVGKFAPNNARHLWLLEQMAISDKDLNALARGEE